MLFELGSFELAWKYLVIECYTFAFPVVVSQIDCVSCKTWRGLCTFRVCSVSARACGMSHRLSNDFDEPAPQAAFHVHLRVACVCVFAFVCARDLRVGIVTT